MATISRKTPQQRATESRHWRWPLALVLGLAATILILLASFLGPPICEPVVAGTKVIEVCKRAPLELLALLFVPSLLLVLPDVSEITFLGVGLKRTLDETADKAHEAARKATHAQEAVGAAAAALVVPAVDAGTAEAAKSNVKLPSAEALELPSDQPRLRDRLVRLWEDVLEGYILMARQQRAGVGSREIAHFGDSSAVNAPEFQEQIRKWADDNWYLANAVEVTYHAALAGEELSTDRLKQVIRIGEALRQQLPPQASR